MRLFLIGILIAALPSLAGDRLAALKMLQGRNDLFSDAQEWEFDTLKHQDRIARVTLVTLASQPPAGPATVVTCPSLVVGSIVCPITGRPGRPVKWPNRAFNALFADYTERHYPDCMCAPRYVLALLVYGKAGDLCSTILLDESHDSIVISDTGKGIRTFRFSQGHSKDARVPRLIKELLRQVGLEYHFLGRE